MKRNLSKVLTLILALAMVLGVMTMGASAAFKDDAEITYKEAVEVAAAIGVINGNPDGSFDPDGILDRAGAAKLICYLLMGKNNAETLVGSGNFKDVPASHWAAGCIDFCVAKGYIAGMGDGTYDPNGTLTQIQFGKLLLCALGYDAQIQGYEGSDWATNVGVDMVKAGLVVDGVDLNAPLTREAAAQMILQTLEADMVRYSNKGTQITMSDGTKVVIGATAAATTYNAEAKDYHDAVADKDELLQFCEQYFPTLRKAVGEADSFNRPASYSWYVDTNKNGAYNTGKDTLVYTVAKAADYSATAKADALLAGSASVADLVTNLNTVLGLSGKAQLASTSYVAANAKFTVNGSTDKDGTLDNCDILTGDEVEVYVDSDKNITDVVITRYTLAKVKSVTALSASQIKANAVNDDEDVVNATSKVVLTYATSGAGTDTSALYNTKISGFNHVAGDYLLVALNSGNTEVLASKAVTTVEGTVAATKSSTYSINGTYYGIAADTVGTVSVLSNGSSGKWVLDAAGKLASEIDVTVKSADYAYVYRIVESNGVSADGIEGAKSYTAYVVLADGTKASYPVALNTTGTNVKGDTSGNIFGDLTKSKTGANTQAAVVAYTINSDGKFQVASASDTIKTVTAVVSKANAVLESGKYATNSTKFVFVEVGASKVDVTTIVGYKNVNISSTNITYVADKTGAASLVFVAGVPAAVDSTAGATLAVLVDAIPVVTGTGTTADPTMYNYSIIVDGKETTLSQKSALTWGAITAGDVFTYTLDSAGVATLTEVCAAGETVAAVIDANTIQTSTTGAIDLTNVTLYTLTIDTTATPTTYTVTAGATFSATAGTDGYNVKVYSTAAGVNTIFVINTVA